MAKKIAKEEEEAIREGHLGTGISGSKWSPNESS